MARVFTFFIPFIAIADESDMHRVYRDAILEPAGDVRD